ncbi:hypothetical protein NADFUDRAFT_52383 [Nadsonia fulvescens var. elongata DSM 6958]|uniref:TERF2-interacting telomeric protein 1 Myb domain-containing protein n=1 Tax=Nadsonia fulvescens var. elongata DSM 6958 TaxID=857566 RepID=A0A1E3PHI3_9ASCO|nr:hypothetical protein NADFUDRAFT_52383 [Nadsonia fulvescens var. elongata DSM 6958]
MSKLFRSKDGAQTEFFIPMKLSDRYEIMELIKEHGGKITVRRGEGIVHIGSPDQHIDIMGRKYTLYSSELIRDSVRTGTFNLESDDHVIEKPYHASFTLSPQKLNSGNQGKYTLISGSNLTSLKGSYNINETSSISETLSISDLKEQARQTNINDSQLEDSIIKIQNFAVKEYTAKKKRLSPLFRISTPSSGTSKPSLDIRPDGTLARAVSSVSNMNMHSDTIQLSDHVSVKQEYPELGYEVIDGERVKRKKIVHAGIVDLTDDNLNFTASINSSPIKGSTSPAFSIASSSMANISALFKTAASEPYSSAMPFEILSKGHKNAINSPLPAEITRSYSGSNSGAVLNPLMKHSSTIDPQNNQHISQTQEIPSSSEIQLGKNSSGIKNSNVFMIGDSKSQPEHPRTTMNNNMESYPSNDGFEVENINAIGPGNAKKNSIETSPATAPLELQNTGPELETQSSPAKLNNNDKDLTTKVHDNKELDVNLPTKTPNDAERNDEDGFDSAYLPSVPASPMQSSLLEKPFQPSKYLSRGKKFNRLDENFSVPFESTFENISEATGQNSKLSEKDSGTDTNKISSGSPKVLDNSYQNNGKMPKKTRNRASRTNTALKSGMKVLQKSPVNNKSDTSEVVRGSNGKSKSLIEDVEKKLKNPNENKARNSKARVWTIAEDDKLFQGLAHYNLDIEDSNTLKALKDMYKPPFTEDEIRNRWSVIKKDPNYMKNLFDRPFVRSITFFGGEKNIFKKGNLGRNRKRVLYNSFEDKILCHFVRLFKPSSSVDTPNSTFFELEKRFPQHTLHSWKERWLRTLRFQVSVEKPHAVTIGELIKYSNELNDLFPGKSFCLVNPHYTSLFYDSTAQILENESVLQSSITSKSLKKEASPLVDDDVYEKPNLTVTNESSGINPFAKRWPRDTFDNAEQDSRKFSLISNPDDHLGRKPYKKTGSLTLYGEATIVNNKLNESESVTPTANNYDASQDDLFSQFANNLDARDSQWEDSQNEDPKLSIKSIAAAEDDIHGNTQTRLSRELFKERQASIDSISNESIRNPFLNDTYSPKPQEIPSSVNMLTPENNIPKDRHASFFFNTKLLESPVTTPTHSQALRPDMVKLKGTARVLKRLFKRCDNTLDDIVEQMKVLYNTDEITVLGSIVSTSFSSERCHEYLKYFVDHDNWPPLSERKLGWWCPDHDKLILSSSMKKDSDEIEYLIELHGYNCTQFRLNFILIVFIKMEHNLPAKLNYILERYNVGCEFFCDLLEATFDLWVTIDYLEKSTYRSKVPTLPGFWSMEESRAIIHGTDKELLEELNLFHGPSEVAYRRQMLLVLEAFSRSMAASRT